tara:strand:+ start:5228 stop:5476 length:249 start_codon:yes stop_codon:yes gene_type:complete
MDIISERGYGMQRGIAQSRDSQDDYTNMNKRNINKQLDTNREQQIKVSSANRIAQKRARKIATGIPQRILNPQQPQAPRGQQ